MDAPSSSAEAAEIVAGEAPPNRRLARLAAWATGSRLRMAIAALACFFILGCVFTSWSYMAHLAEEAIQPVTLDMALAALDEGRFDDAKSMIGDMHRLPASPELVGGAMFVLGAAKVHEAEQETSAERQQAMYQLAAKYLLQARTLDVPAGREGQAAYLLGKSQVHGGRAPSGISALEEALSDPAQPQVEIHELLARALLEAPDPDLEAALAHNDAVLADNALPEAARHLAWAQRAETLIRLSRMEEAQAAIDQVPEAGSLVALRRLLLGCLELHAAERLPQEDSQRGEKLNAAIGNLREATRLDTTASRVTRQSLYWVGRGLELSGDQVAALFEYERLAKLFGETPEGVTAMLAAADCHRRAGRIDRALAAYRWVLETVGDPHSYENPLLPLAELKKRLTSVYQQFLNDGFFEESLLLAEQFEPVFGRATRIEQCAQTHRRWGARLVEQGQAEDRWQRSDAEQVGRGHLRAAGRSFEDLAALRRASRAYTDDLWAAAECYFDGHSFTNATRLFEEYLHHEAQRRNAMALLRLGQSRLAQSEFDEAAKAFEESIELYPRDAVVYQARLECARAYQQRGKFAEAERLLTANLMSEGLTPSSPEWRDSKFALGRLHYEAERYDEAIATLDEAVKRYENEDAALLAKYTMARAYHNASELPAKRLREVKSESEVQKNRKLSADYLNLAHATYQDVQRTITLRGPADADPLDQALLRNCYMMQGSVLFELRRFEEARQAYGNVITLYQNDPIVLESFVQVANCWRRLSQPVKARVTLDQAKMVLDRLPKDVDFLASTNFNRQQWELLLSQMSKW